MVVVAAAVLGLAIAAPASAHFCFKTGWNDASAAGAAGSKAWMTKAEWLAFIDAHEDEICPAGAAILRGAVNAAPEGTLFMGPGLLAGGNLKHGKESPGQFAYLPIFEAFAACGFTP
jgi:hypothetical protein